MNPLIKEQLNKIKKVKLPSFDDNTTVIALARSNEAVTATLLQEDCCYIISVEDYILNPPEGFTLHTNWNNNIIPKHKTMKIDVNKIMGKMVKVNAIGYDMKKQANTNDVWSGWLPQKSITIIERL